MLVLSRKLHETIVIDGDIRITVVSIRGNQVRLGITAPRSVKIFRDELYARADQANEPRGRRSPAWQTDTTRTARSHLSATTDRATNPESTDRQPIQERGASDMLRSILIGIDDSECGNAALELGVRWAKGLSAQLVGLAVVDDPGIHRSEELMFGEGFHRPVGRTMVAEARRKIVEHLQEAKTRFRRRCQEAGVHFRLLDEIGSPHVQILLEAQEHDVVILGQQSRFEYGSQDDPDQTLAKVIQDSPRPVVVVPDALVGGDSIVIAYDGSLQASRVLLAFESSGLGSGAQVHVVAVDTDRRDAAHAPTAPSHS